MKIHLSSIAINTIIGINDWEKKNKQPLFIDLTLTYDATQAAQSDDISHAVDYDSLTRAIIKHAEENHYNLLETLAEKLLELVFTQHETVTHALIHIKKPQALEPMAAHASIIHEKSR